MAVAVRLLAVGNAVGAGVGVWECLWARVRARVLGGRPPPPPPAILCSQEPWHPLLTRDVLNTALLREDWALRCAFMNGLPPPAPNLQPFYAPDGALHEAFVAQRPLSAEEGAHPRIKALRDPGPALTTRMPCGSGASSLMPHLRGFEFFFREFTGNALKGVFGLATQPDQVWASSGIPSALVRLDLPLLSFPRRTAGGGHCSAEHGHGFCGNAMCWSGEARKRFAGGDVVRAPLRYGFGKGLT